MEKNTIYYYHGRIKDSDFEDGKMPKLRLIVKGKVQRKLVYKLTRCRYLTPNAIKKLEKEGYTIKQYISRW